MADKDLFDYNEDSIKSLDWKEHIRLRPGMYIGKLGDGSSHDDGIYVLVEFNATPEIDDELSRVMKISDEVIRYLLVQAAA